MSASTVASSLSPNPNPLGPESQAVSSNVPLGQVVGGFTLPLKYFHVAPKGTTVRTVKAFVTFNVQAWSANPAAFAARSFTAYAPVMAGTPATAPVDGLTLSHPGFVINDHVMGALPPAAGTYV